MKDHALEIYLNQLAGVIEREISREQDVDRNCRLQNAKELIRRAFHEINGTPYEENDLIKL